MTRAGVLTIPEKQGQGSNVETIRTEIRTEIKDLDPDKYIGTIGLIADKPDGALKVHYTSFPEDPEEGNWVRVVSETTIDSKSLLIGQEWICVTAKTSNKEAVWELAQTGEVQPVYPMHQRCIGHCRRSLETINLQPLSRIVNPNTTLFIPFFRPISEGAFENPLGMNSSRFLLNLADLVVKGATIDFYLRIDFSPDTEGTRQAGVVVYAYHPTDQNLYDVLLSDYTVELRTGGASSPPLLWRPRVGVPLVTPLDDTPLTYAVGAWVRSTADTSVTITFAELALTAWR
jgi:hypothetical protein